MSRLPSINVHENVEKPDAYITAAKNRIKANRAKGARAKWMAESANAQTCIDFLFGTGEFEGKEKLGYHEDGEPFVTRISHPVVKAAFGEFYAKMAETVLEWGRLTEGQERAVLGMIDKAKARIEARKAALAEKMADCKHVGTIGERRDFELTVVFKTSFESQFGGTNVYIMEDADKNVIVYKGSAFLKALDGSFISNDGKCNEAVKMKATIKAHDFRENVPQTILSRPSQK